MFLMFFCFFLIFVRFCVFLMFLVLWARSPYLPRTFPVPSPYLSPYLWLHFRFFQIICENVAKTYKKQQNHEKNTKNIKNLWKPLKIHKNHKMFVKTRKFMKKHRFNEKMLEWVRSHEFLWKKLHNICVQAFVNTNMKIHTTSVVNQNDE